MLDKSAKVIGKEILSSERILLVSHIRPDGDAIGSLLGLGLALTEAGKDVQMVSEDGIPQNFMFLAGHELVSNGISKDFDYVISLDCSEPTRMGQISDEISEVNLNIDHHITNTNFGLKNLVDPGAVATVEIIFDFLILNQINIPEDSANALLTGLVTDTLGFRTSNMSSHAMRTAGELIDFKADLSNIYNKSLINRSFAAIRYWGMGLSHASMEEGILWTSLSLEDRQMVSYPGRDDADLINVLSSVDDARVAIIFVEQKGNEVKVSWRAKRGTDVSTIAQKFGGGGHPAAAGASISGNLEDVIREVLTSTSACLNQ